MNAAQPYDKDWSWHEAETDDDREDRAAWSLVEESRFPASRVYRARRRLREQPPVSSPRYVDCWTLPGLDTFADEYAEYVVSLRDGRYACSCWSHAWGGARAKRFCSHVLAVILWRRRLAKDDDQAPQVADRPHDLAAEGASTTDEPSVTTEAVAGWSKPSDLGFDGNRFPSFRGVQLYGIQKIATAFQSGAKVVFCQAPTGVGKSLLAAAVGKVLDAPVVYASTTKLLQDQFLDSFPSSKTLKGRANYTPLNYLSIEEGCDDRDAHVHDGGDLPTCAECNKEDGRCTFCHDVRQCPYQLAKREALASEQAVLNTAYYVSECNTAARFSDWSQDGLAARHPQGLRLVVFDEGDALEGALLSHVTLEVARHRMDELEIEPPPHKDPSDKEGEWGDWISTTVLPAGERRIAALTELHDLLRTTVEKAEDRGFKPSDRIDVTGRTRDLWPLVSPHPLPASASVMVLRKFTAQANKRLRSLTYWVGQVRFMAADLRENAQSWVRTDDPSRNETLTFKPVKVDRFAGAALWRHAARFLVMSATLLTKTRMCRDLGVAEDESAWVDLPSTFSPARRPIYYLPVASMDRKAQSESLPLVIDAVNKIIDSRPDDRVLVHSVSYALADQLCSGLRAKDRLVTFGGGKTRDYGPGDFGHGGRDAALAYYASHPGSVLIAPALDRGIDLPDDLCRCCVVVKIPKPSLGDKQVQRRLYGFGREGKEWYAAQTVRTLCQATGRGFRHERDWCETFILDESFDRLWRENKHLFPQWWKAALVTVDTDDLSFLEKREPSLTT